MKNFYLTVLMVLIITISYTEDKPKDDAKAKITANLKSMENLYFKYLSFDERRAAIRLMDDTLSMIQNLYVKEEVKETREEQRLLSENEFSYILSQMKETMFDDKKIEIVIAVASNSYLTISQLKMIVDQIRFEDHKVDAIKALYPKVIAKDKKNWMILMQGIQSSFTKDDLMKYFQTNQQ